MSWNQKKFSIKPFALSVSDMSVCLLQKIFLVISERLAIAETRKKLMRLNKIPGNRIEATTDPQRIQEADFVIIAVPTPVTKAKDPDLEPVISASEVVGQNLKKGAIVVLESTVYPGVTEEIMGPILERESGLHAEKISRSVILLNGSIQVMRNTS